MEQRELIPESQAGFRKGRRTVDNIFILSHVVQREREKEEEGKERKVFAFFVDLKAAFDNVNREKLWELMERWSINGNIIDRLKGIYRETRAAIRTKDGLSEEIKTRKGVRQGCVLSPILFNMYIAEIDKYLDVRGIGGIKIGKERIWSLAYADDLILLAKNKEAVTDMMGTLRRFLKDRKLDLNVEKSKVMVFNSGGREKKRKWIWEGKEIEEVQNFKYLGFTFNKRGDYASHIKELRRKGRMAANIVWGIGERMCKNDFTRRWILFRYLVESVMAYGVEIWGWEERKELEKILLDYMRWMFKLDFCTPRYLVTRELGLGKLRVEWGIRARRYEEKIEEMGEERWVKMCWREKRRDGWKGVYGKEREKYYNRNGWGVSAIDSMPRAERNLIEELRERESDVQAQEEESRIKEARYNRRYKEFRKENGVPRYIEEGIVRGGKRGEGIRALIRLRCGNMENDNKYWLEEEKRTCIFCKEGKDNMEHFIGECRIVMEWFVGLGENTRDRIRELENEELDEKKEGLLIKFWKEKEKLRRKEEEETKEKEKAMRFKE